MGIGSITPGEASRHIQCLEQQHLSGDELDHSAEDIFCALDKGSVSASVEDLD